MESKEDATLKLTKAFVESGPKPPPLKQNTHKAKMTQQEKEYCKHESLLLRQEEL